MSFGSHPWFVGIKEPQMLNMDSRFLANRIFFERMERENSGSSYSNLPTGFIWGLFFFVKGNGKSPDFQGKFWGWVNYLPSRKLTYPPKNGILKMIFRFPRWDMLVPWKVWFGPDVLSRLSLGDAQESPRPRLANESLGWDPLLETWWPLLG